MPKPKIAADYEKLAFKRGYVWLGPFPDNTKLKTKWRCENNHEFAACYGNINQGMNCKKCVLEQNASQQRHGPEDYHALAQERGFRWIGPPVNSVVADTVWECQEGHRWSARYNSLQSAKSGCPICGFERSAAAKRRTPSDYIALANQKEIIWLGDIVKSTKSDTRWRCPTCDHVWLSPFSTIRAAKVFPCPNCSPRRPKSEADFHALAESRDFKWIGETLVNTRTNTLWECQKCRRKWPAPYSNILGGSGCPSCANLAPKIEEDYRALAQRRQIEWLGPMAVNTKEPTVWRCAAGHQWRASYNQIHRTRQCWQCSDTFPRTRDDYLVLAAERGFEWLGPFPDNAMQKTEWKCSKGHTWPAPYTSIKRGNRCPSCVNMVNGTLVSKNQLALCEMVGGKPNEEKVGRFTPDVVKRINGVQIAIEYDSWFFHGADPERDKKRDDFFREAGWRVLRIRSNKLLPSKAQLDEAIQKLIDGALWWDIELEDWRDGPTYRDIGWK